MNGSIPVLIDVEAPVDDQQRVDNPLDGLLDLVEPGAGSRSLLRVQCPRVDP